MRIRRKNNNGHNANDISTRLNSMRSGLDALQGDVRALLNDVSDATSDQIQGAMRSASQSAQGAVDRVEKWGNENLDGVRKTVRGRPLSACALSIGAGALLSAIVLRL